MHGCQSEPTDGSKGNSFDHLLILLLFWLFSSFFFYDFYVYLSLFPSHLSDHPSLATTPSMRSSRCESPILRGGSLEFLRLGSKWRSYWLHHLPVQPVQPTFLKDMNWCTFVLILCLMQFNMHAIIAMQLSVSVSAVQPVAKNSPDGENFMVLTSARCFRSTAFSTKPSAVVSCTSMVGRVLIF